MFYIGRTSEVSGVLCELLRRGHGYLLIRVEQSKTSLVLTHSESLLALFCAPSRYRFQFQLRLVLVLHFASVPFCMFCWHVIQSSLKLPLYAVCRFMPGGLAGFSCATFYLISAPLVNLHLA